MTLLESTATLENTSQQLSKSVNNYKLGVTNIIYQVSIAKDGNRWCALMGKDLQDGVAGFGATIQEALHDLANNIKE